MKQVTKASAFTYLLKRLIVIYNVDATFISSQLYEGLIKGLRHCVRESLQFCENMRHFKAKKWMFFQFMDEKSLNLIV